MSEHRYYEFEAVDRALTPGEREELRLLSSRAEISSRRFTNTYNYGDFRGDPAALMARFFDVHVYLANWGTRRLMVRLPRRAIDEGAVVAALAGLESTDVAVAGDHLVIDMDRQIDDDGGAGADRDDGDWLPALAPLREAMIDGDLRLVTLAWLSEVSGGAVDATDREPLSGLGPLSPAIRAFAEFFSIDRDLLAVAAERTGVAEPAGRDAAAEIASLSAVEKDLWLARLHGGEPGLGAAFRARLRPPPAPTAAPAARRTAADLLARAEALAVERRASEACAAADERRLAEARAERERQARIGALASRGGRAWQEVEAEVERRNASGYGRAAALLFDLRGLAERDGAVPAFAARLSRIRARHAAKRKFIERLDGMPGLDGTA